MADSGISSDITVIVAGMAVMAAVIAIEEEEEIQEVEPRRSDRLLIRYIQREFSYWSIEHDSCLHLFRFDHWEIQRLTRCFDLNAIEYPFRMKPPATTSLCIVLYRLARPRSYADRTTLFGRSPVWLSNVFNTVIMTVAQNSVGKSTGMLIVSHYPCYRSMLMPCMQQEDRKTSGLSSTER